MIGCSRLMPSRRSSHLIHIPNGMLLLLHSLHKQKQQLVPAAADWLLPQLQHKRPESPDPLIQWLLQPQPLLPLPLHLLQQQQNASHLLHQQDCSQ